jgi:hypothetical protein
VLSPASATAQQEAVQPATGFMVQPMLAVGSTVGAPAPTPPPEGGAAEDAEFGGVSTLGFAMVPTVRVGAMLRPLAVALNFGFTFDTLQAGDVKRTNSVLNVGVDVEPFIWRAPDGKTRVYVLGGAGVLFTEQPGSVKTAAGPTFTVGLGGLYSVHTNFAIGMELGSQLQLLFLPDATAITNRMYFGFHGTFVAGS